MKQTLRILTLVTIFLTNQSFCTPFLKVSGFPTSTVKRTKETVILNSGTPISLKMNQNMNSDDVQIGNAVILMTDDVAVAEGQVVIKQNVRAEGKVTDIRRQNDCKRCPDKFQTIEITVERVLAIDGQYVKLFGPVFSAHSKCMKCPVLLNTAMRFQAFVQSNTVITTR